MHVEVPKAKNFKEFGGEFLMIVVSILTALLLEYVVETVHHHHKARDAAERMDVELRLNGKEIAAVLQNNEARIAALRTVQETMRASLRNHEANEAILRRFGDDTGHTFDMKLQYPTLRREAWETAVADQSVTWMPRAQLERYAAAYSAMRDVNAMFAGNAIHFLDGARMVDAVSDIEMGGGDAKTIFRFNNQLMMAYSSVDGVLRNLQKDLAPTTSND
jgi:ABC-type dipeptide/oligopeptide/nickel transport system ATPase component